MSDEVTKMFKTGSRRHHSTPTGLDWALIRKEYLAACSPEEYAAMQTPNGKAPAKPAAPKPAGESGGVYAKTPADVEDKVVQLYDGGRGAQTGQISSECGIHPATVRRILRARGVYDPSMVRYG